jgi:hypothetical protein
MQLRGKVTRWLIQHVKTGVQRSYGCPHAARISGADRAGEVWFEETQE